MATEKLYYQDCHRRQFCARVESCLQTDQGYEVVLDATAFYPEGGGQACDTGFLAEAKVLMVKEVGDAVVHICDKPLIAGQTVQGQIDYSRRFDLMQQHTGEHILSGVIYRRYGFHNSGFHVGQQVMEVDFDGVIPATELAEVEWEANQAVWANLPVHCTVPPKQELKQLFYRTKRELPWPVRIVEIPGIDSCACCGVHTAYTGEVGLIKIVSCVKLRQGVRLELACGARAMRYVNQVWEQNREISQLLSAKMQETAAAVRKQNNQLAEEKFRAGQLQRQLFEGIAEKYAEKGNVVHFASALSGGELRLLTELICAQCGGVAAVVSGEDGNYSVCLGSETVDVSDLGKELSTALNGRGGGRGGFFQGTIRAGKDKIEGFLRNRLL